MAVSTQLGEPVFQQTGLYPPNNGGDTMLQLKKMSRIRATMIALVALNFIAGGAVAVARADDDDRCSSENPCRCEFEGTPGGWCSHLGYGSPCSGSSKECTGQT